MSHLAVTGGWPGYIIASIMIGDGCLSGALDLTVGANEHHDADIKW